jgi:hypothetical protein
VRAAGLRTRLLQAVPAEDSVHWTATPDTAAQAAELAGAPVAALSLGEG